MSKNHLSHVKNRLFNTAVQVQESPYDVDPAFTPRELMQATLPHKNPGDVPRWMRRNGNYALLIQPGWDPWTDQSVGYPYGSIPRLLIFWLTTEALRTGNRRLELGGSLADFMRRLGLNPQTGGGKRGDAARLRNQMNRLFCARISFQYQEEMEGVHCQTRLDMQVAPKSKMWWSERSPEDSALMGSWIELGEEFFKAITEHPIPVDMRALQAIKHSSLALDLYAWAAHATFRAQGKGEARIVRWRSLMQQVGAHYSDVKDFKKKAKAALKQIQLVYPNLRIESVNGGLEVKPSLPAVLPRNKN